MTSLADLRSGALPLPLASENRREFQRGDLLAQFFSEQLSAQDGLGDFGHQLGVLAEAAGPRNLVVFEAEAA
jgi:hypothetical protein